eukprot:scaffold307906_cov19-Prasinocladus_malaysianus.AAC.1
MEALRQRQPLMQLELKVNVIAEKQSDTVASLSVLNLVNGRFCCTSEQTTTHENNGGLSRLSLP